MSAYQFVLGKPLFYTDLSCEVLSQIVSYCEFRLKEFGERQQTEHPLEEMAKFNFSQETGGELYLPQGCLASQHLIVADGRMQPHEWIRDHDDSLQKVDACSHGDDPFFPGPTDIAWDLAGAVVEWQMNSDAEEFMASRFHHRTGDDVSYRLPFFILAYSIFRMAYCKMAAHATQNAGEKQRLVNAYQMYRRRAESQAEISKATPRKP